MLGFIEDVTYGLRQFRKSLGFTATAVVSLALAIGANTTIFSFANQMLFVHLGVPHPDQLRTLFAVGDEHMAAHAMWGSSTGENGRRQLDSFTMPVYKALRQHDAGIFAFKQLGSANVTAGGVAQAGRVELVSGNFYEQMQVKPQLGRAILPSDDGAPGTGPVVVLSDAFWHHAFGGAADVVGRSITLEGASFTVIGVNPPEFTGPDGANAEAPQMFVPISMVSVLNPGRDGFDPLGGKLWWIELMTRAKPGVSDIQAQAEMDTVLSAAVRGSMTLDKQDTMPHVLLADGSRGAGDWMVRRQYGKPISVLLGLSGLVLLLACANIANLMLARATGRQREISVRMALGAGRGRILRQVLTESLMLSCMGGVAGLFLGYLGRNLIPWLMSNGWEGGEINTPFDWRVFAFTAFVTLATGILFGVAPAMRSTRVSIHLAMKETSRSASRRRKAWTGKAIVGFQVALSTLLVLSAAWFVRTIWNLSSVDPGFQAQNLLLVEVNPPQGRYPEPKDVAVERRLETAFSALPGVKAVSLAAIPLVSGSMWNSGFHVEGETGERFAKKDMRNFPDIDAVGGSFFSTMGIPILAGRGFTDQDTETSVPVSVVNQSLARLYFPNTNPVGKRFRTSTEGPGAKWIEIVGICADTRYNDLKEDAPPLHFEPYRQVSGLGGVTYLIRTTMPTAQLLPLLRDAAKKIDPDLPLTAVRTQQQQIEANTQQERMFASLTAGFGLLAVALAVVGIYGIMAYTVSQRTNEIGIRLALGAARNRILAMVLQETAWLAGIGVVIGVAASLALGHLVESMLYGLKFTDPLALGGSILLLVAVACVAGWVPAHRASRVEPIDALRQE